MSYFRRLLPTWPPVPRLLWLTLAGAALAALNLLFYDEIWSGRLQKKLAMLGIVLPLLLLGPQLVRLLWRWPVPPAAPGWWQQLWRLATRLAATAMVLGTLLVGALLVVFWLFSGG